VKTKSRNNESESE